MMNDLINADSPTIDREVLVFHKDDREADRLAALIQAGRAPEDEPRHPVNSHDCLINSPSDDVEFNFFISIISLSFKNLDHMPCTLLGHFAFFAYTFGDPKSEEKAKNALRRFKSSFSSRYYSRLSSYYSLIAVQEAESSVKKTKPTLILRVDKLGKANEIDRQKILRKICEASGKPRITESDYAKFSTLKESQVEEILTRLPRMRLAYKVGSIFTKKSRSDEFTQFENALRESSVPKFIELEKSDATELLKNTSSFFSKTARPLMLKMLMLFLDTNRIEGEPLKVHYKENPKEVVKAWIKLMMLLEFSISHRESKEVRRRCSPNTSPDNSFNYSKNGGKGCPLGKAFLGAKPGSKDQIPQEEDGNNINNALPNPPKSN